jgi:hypothetical protein
MCFFMTVRGFDGRCRRHRQRAIVSGAGCFVAVDAVDPFHPSIEIDDLALA